MSARLPSLWTRFFSRYTSLQSVLMGSVVLQVLAVTGLTGYFSFRNGQTAIQALTVQVRNQASATIHTQLTPYLAAPHQLNQIKANAIRLNHINADDFDRLRPYLLAQLQVFDSVTNTGVATVSGDYISVGRRIDGSFSNPVIDLAQGKFFQYGLDQDGNRTGILRVAPYEDPRLSKWYRQVTKNGKATWSPIFTWTFKEFGIGLMAGQPIYDETGKQVGAVNSGLILDHISGFLRKLEIAQSGKVFVVERSGLLVATSTAESPIRPSADQTTSERIAALESQDPLIRQTTQYLIKRFGNLAQIQHSQQIDFDIAGEQQFVQLTPITDDLGIDWLAIIVVPRSAFAAQIHAYTQTIFWLCLMALLLSAGLGWLTARWLAVPIQRLSQATRKLAEGDLDYRVEEQHGAQELNALAQTFNQMAEQLQASFEVLYQSEEKFRQLAENIHEVFWLSDAELRQCLYISPAYQDVWGRSCESMYVEPQSFIDAIHPADRQRVIDNLAVNATRPFEIEYRVVQPNGEIRWVCDRCSPVYDASGTVIRRAGVAQDITERKLAEMHLQKTAERERLVRMVTERIRQSLNLDEILITTVNEVRQVLRADRVIVLKLATDGSGKVVQESVDANWQSILGQTITEPGCLQSESMQHCSGGQVWAIADAKDGSLQARYTDFLRQFQVRANLVVPIIQNDAYWGLLIAHQCAQPRLWDEDEVLLLKQLANQVAIALQQSELYHQLQQLNASLERQVQQRTEALQQALEFESLLQRIADKVRETLEEQQVIQTAVDELARVLHTNGCGIGLFDLEQETSTICYAELHDVPSLHDRVFHFANYPELYQQLLRGEPLQFCGIVEHVYPMPPNPLDGVILVCPLLDNRGALGELWLHRMGDSLFTEAEVRLVQQVANQCAIGIRQSRLYQASQVQVEALEQLHQMKDDFLSTVSHELRSPMTNIKMAIQMVELRLNQQQVQDDRLTQYLHILEQGCAQELALINDLLDLQRLEAGMQPLELEEVNLNSWLLSIAESFEVRARKQHQQFNLDIPLNLPTITTDLSSLKRIVMELLHNACKYTPPNENITIAAQVKDASLHIQVSNSGVELPAEELPRLFDKFYRVTGSDRWKQGGTGLGLALVKRLVEHLDGSISVESANALTCFTIQLPLNMQFSN